jgi:DNA helicase-2/ATP-dependent DNA helicase PcrA
MILALTFSNKAKDNLASRMRQVVGPSWRQRIAVTNFHGFATRVVKAHGRTIGLREDILLPEETWRRRRRRELGINFRNGDAFEAALRDAKSGAFNDAEVMTRLLTAGNDAAVTYERSLRSEGRLDHDDLIRHLARLLQNPMVSRLYQAHFGMVMVDEVQDLSMLQYDIVRGVGGDRVTYVGDPAQAIYSFAGADAVAVMARIRALTPEIVEFHTSYRSTAAVLAAVNVLAREMGATELTCGCPEKWPDAGRVIYIERGDTDQEAVALVRMVERIFEEKADATIGVVGRRGTRMAQLQGALASAGVGFEDWSMATHVPQVVDLLQRHLREAMAIADSPEATLAELGRLCREALDPADASTADELSSACDGLQEHVTGGMLLADAVAMCRTSPVPGAPVAPGLHLLTGHRGKGQEFDWVIVIGLEEGHVPDFRNDADPEELRILHVMVSRARYGVVLTYSRYTPTRGGWRASTPSRWLPLLRSTATETDAQ